MFVCLQVLLYLLTLYSKFHFFQYPTFVHERLFEKYNDASIYPIPIYSIRFALNSNYQNILTGLAHTRECSERLRLKFRRFSR